MRASREASVYRHNTDKAVICGHLILTPRHIVTSTSEPGTWRKHLTCTWFRELSRHNQVNKKRLHDILQSTEPQNLITLTAQQCIAYAVGHKYHLNVMFLLHQLPSGCCPSVLMMRRKALSAGSHVMRYSTS